MVSGHYTEDGGIFRRRIREGVHEARRPFVSTPGTRYGLMCRNIDEVFGEGWRAV